MTTTDDGTGQAREPAEKGNRLRLLVVEDEALILMTTVDMLEDLGHAVVSAGNGAAALAVLGGEGEVDAMLTDINLPDVSGLRLAEEARRLRPGLPVVFTTGHRMAVPEELAATGPTAMLGKPYWTQELEKALREVC